MHADKPPRIRRTNHNTQLTYNVAGRVHCVKTYPGLSPQGATIILYGHDNGVTVVWRGGRRFKAAAAAAAAAAVAAENGTGSTANAAAPTAGPSSSSRPMANGHAVDDSVMVVDSDDDTRDSKDAAAAALRPYSNAPDFDSDASDPALRSEIVQTLELAVGGAVLHVAVPAMAPGSADDAQWAGGGGGGGGGGSGGSGGGTAAVLGEKLVFAVSCASGDAMVVSLPLTPPSPESKARAELRRGLVAGRLGSGLWGETVVRLHGLAAPARGLAAVVFRPTRTTTSGSASGAKHAKPRLVVAAHNAEASGVLRLWDVDVEAARLGDDAAPVVPFQTEHLPAYASSVSFNRTHPTQLLVVFPRQAVRVYDFAAPSFRQAEFSSGTTLPSAGSWLLSLYPPFGRPAGTRKPIVDAAWIAHGRAVLVLLADGMWGVWDIDGSATNTSVTTATALAVANPNARTSGLRGGAITAFSASGYVEGTGSLRGAGLSQQQQQQGQGHAAKPGEFVPMTPQTRRDAAAAFHGVTSPSSSSSLFPTPSSSSSTTTTTTTAAVCGGISITTLPATRAAAAADEAAVLWLGDRDPHVCVIPGVARFRNAQLRKSAGGGVNLFSGAQPTRMVRLHNLAVGLLGERCCGVEALCGAGTGTAPVGHDLSGGGRQRDGPTGDVGLPIDVLVRGETRIVVVVRDTDDSAVAHKHAAAAAAAHVAPRSSLASKAIIVHGATDRKTYDLSLGRPGVLQPSRRVAADQPLVSALVPLAPGDYDDDGGDDDDDDNDGNNGNYNGYDNDDSPSRAAAAARRRKTARLRHASAPRPDRFGFGFGLGTSLSAAADAVVAGDDTARDSGFGGMMGGMGRLSGDAETEMLDIMDLDRALDVMAHERETGRKRVFFEDC